MSEKASLIQYRLEQARESLKAHYLEEQQALLTTKNSWDTLIRSLDEFSDDFMAERNQPKAKKLEGERTV